MLVEQLHQLGEVGQRPGQPVDFVDDDHVHRPRPDVAEGSLSAGRSVLPPENPPSSYLARRTVIRHAPGYGYRLATASYCASRELKSCSSPWSVDTRV